MSTGGFEIDDIETQKQDRKLIQNRNRLEEAKSVGYACEDMANDIKYNLRN